MSTPPAPARVFDFVAAEADVCVLLRRGPTRRVLMVRWDLATDTFEIGQWLKGTVKAERSELSADGKLFGYYVLDYRQKPVDDLGPYVALSRPPYFTALALWWAGGMHTGGARWHGARELSAYEGESGPPDKGAVSKDFRLVSRDRKLYAWWMETPQKPVLERAAKFDIPLSFDLLGRYEFDGEPLTVEWADVDHRGRLLFAHEGRVFIRDSSGERELIDLNPFQFEPVAPSE